MQQNLFENNKLESKSSQIKNLQVLDQAKRIWKRKKKKIMTLYSI